MNLFKKPTLLDHYKEVMDWIRTHSIPGQGIAISNKQPVAYPEVTGYLIPSLLEFGHHKLAEQYCDWLLSIQEPQGFWWGSDKYPSFFDTGQVLRGLLAMREYYEYRPATPFSPGWGSGWSVIPGMVDKINSALLYAVYWMADQINQDGSINIQNREAFRFYADEFAPECVMLYALEPLRRACHAIGREKLIPNINHSMMHYAKTVPATLSHYQKYIEEALCDIGCFSLARSAPVPKYNCTPGTYQAVVVAGKLGYPTSLTYNGLTGGNSFYFPHEQVSWSAKFFLDALDWHMRSAFKPDPNHPKEISRNDARFIGLCRRLDLGGKILDAGAGSGRYAARIKDHIPQADITCLDISPVMVSFCRDRGLKADRGSLMNIPYHSESFDAVYCVESLEHCVNKPAAIAQLCRVTKKGGNVIIIDKDEHTTVKMVLAPWEEWPKSREVVHGLSGHCESVHREEIDNIFTIWEGVKK